MKKPSLLRACPAALFAGVILAGCVSPGKAKYQKGAAMVSTLPLYEQETYLRLSYANGSLSKEHYDQLMASVQAQKKKAEAAAAQLAIMTPKERAAYIYVLQQGQKEAITRRQFVTQQAQVYDATIQQRKKNAEYKLSHPAVAASDDLYTPVPFNSHPPTVAPSGPVYKTGD
jgi:hypothetical protein